MAIAKMNRFTLLAFHAHKQELLKQLQVFGDVHLHTPGPEELEELSFLRPDYAQEQLGRCEAELEKVRFAVKRLAPYAGKPGLTAHRPTLTFQEFDGYVAGYDYASVYEKVHAKDEEVTNITAEIQRRTAENAMLASWSKLDIAPSELAALQKTGYLLGTVNRQTLDELTARVEEQFEAVYIEQLDTVKEDVGLLVLFPEEQFEDLFACAREVGFTRIAFDLGGVPAKRIEENNAAVTQLERQKEDAAEAIREQASEHPHLQIAQDYFETVLERERARQSMLASETTVLIEGWVPADDSEKLQGILKAVCGDEFFLEETPTPHDSTDVPIKLKNNAFNRAFESITSMYSMPRYNEIDPTPLLAPFYWIFFGMMVGDIGYGLLMLVATTIVLAKIDLKESMRDFMKFFQYLSIAVTGAGVLYGGCFGVTVFAPISNGDGTYRAILDTQLSITTMLIISIIIGIVHILFGLAIKAYMGFRDGRPFDGFCDGILWMLTLITAIGWMLGGTGIVEMPWRPFRIGCVVCVVLLAATQGRESPSIGGKIGNGLYSVYGLTSYVGDIVSYTRIVALALSGAYIGYAFNMMTELVIGTFGAGNIVVSLLRVLFGVCVAVFGQALNVGLALLGAYVHSCRLQYVEFFGKFYDGGGVVFRPFRLKNEYSHIKKQEEI